MVRNSIIICVAVIAVAVGIVVIPPLVSSPDAANCTAEQATDVGIVNFVSAVTPDRSISEVFFDQEGSPLTLANYRGKFLLVNFWATWCAPCVAEMPALDRMQAILTHTDIKVLAINEDRNGAELATAFYAENQLQNLEVLVDKNQKFLRAAGVTGLPTTLLVSDEGQIMAAVLGDEQWDSRDIVSFIKTCFGYSAS